VIYYYYEGLGQPGTRDGLDGRHLGQKGFVALPPEWELFDLDKDPREMNNVYDDSAYNDVVRELTAELHRLQKEAGDKPFKPGDPGRAGRVLSAAAPAALLCAGGWLLRQHGLVPGSILDAADYCGGISAVASLTRSLSGLRRP